MESSRLIQFEIPGAPKVQERPRMVSKGGRTWMYSPSTKDQEVIGHIALAERTKRGLAIMQGPVALKVNFYGLLSKQDLSNALKLIEDGMNKVIYNDDAQIYELHAYRINVQENPHTVVMVWEI